ncbi:hypothetical protein [Halapricum desulfuricans]|uniref:Small CPxCG-related zinc finger protein n=1 Tax=Halapricum desulfuricans TaxID=2841257 RepID=A0A897NAE7_9EURY|nr:hypothetical protein [Halapricum desulfuricans]QSG08073.1 Uncharacterized protein HSR122_0667 [Halapricum desulfuricans]QSG12800.1 Uncharacterized protein HSBGL_2395 [Halapricum desulfuricans]
MALETCGSCGEQVPFADTVHVLVHTKGEDGVVDAYVCRECYEQQLRPIVESSDIDGDEATADSP